MSSTLTSSLVVKLIDAISAPAKGAARSLATIGDAARRLNGTNVGGFANRLGEVARRNAEQMDALRGKMIDAAAMGYGLTRALGAPLDQARAFESVLLDIGQKANLTDDGIAKLSQRISGLSTRLQKTLSQTDLAKGVDFLAGMGLDPDNAVAMLEPIGRAAHAYKADVEDLARAGFAAFDNLKVPADQFTRALDAMAQSGKEGAFELRDMARYFPSLGSTFQGLGQTGVGAVADLAAALQVARKGAGDSEEAANNLANVLQKLASPDTVRKFKKLGIDIRAELEKAQASGKSPIEMIAEQTNKALKGNLSHISDLFEDSQVQKGLRAIILNMEEYRRIREEALGAENVVNADFERRLRTGDAALATFKNRMADLGRIVGTILLPAINDLLEISGKWASTIAEFAERYPTMTKVVVALSAAVVGLRVAMIGAAFATRFAFGGILSGAIGAVAAGGKLKGLGALMFAPFLAFGTRIKGILQTIALRFRLARAAGIGFGRSFVAGTAATMTRALLSLLAPIAILRGALRLLRLAMIGTGIGAAFVALGFLAEWVANNWEGIGVAFEAFKGSFMRNIAPVKEQLQPIIEAFASLFGKVDSLTGAIDNRTWTEWVIAAGAATAAMVVDITRGISKVVGAFRSVAQKIRTALFETDYAAAGREVIQNLWNGMISKFGELLEWVRQIPSKIVSAIGSIDLSGIVQWPSMPSWLGGGAGSASPKNSAFNGDGVPVGGGSGAPPARARGGHVKAGHLYQVNDDGSGDPTELFMPGKSGTVLPSSQRKKLGGGSDRPGAIVRVTNHFTISGGNAREIADEVARKVEGSVSSFSRTLFSDSNLRGA